MDKIRLKNVNLTLFFGLDLENIIGQIKHDKILVVINGESLEIIDNNDKEFFKDYKYEHFSNSNHINKYYFRNSKIDDLICVYTKIPYLKYPDNLPETESSEEDEENSSSEEEDDDNSVSSEDEEMIDSSSEYSNNSDIETLLTETENEEEIS